jgi:hypothetical protein
MFTVLPNIRNSKMYLVVAAAVALLAVLAVAIAPSIALHPSSNNPESVDLSLPARPVVIPPTGSQEAHDEFRKEELALYDRLGPSTSSIGGLAFYEYRRGEWVMIGAIDPIGELRREELSLYNRSTDSSLGGPAFYEYRQGEWLLGAVDAIGAFRQEELLLYNRSANSSIGGAAFYEYRRGEWTGQ